MTTIIRWMVQLILCIILLSLSGWTTVGNPEPVEWVPYTTAKHSEMADNTDFSFRIYNYLKYQRKLEEPELTKQFKHWYGTNLGHVFEEGALASYGILKNHRMFNGRIPDAVENGKLEQIVQYTDYPASTFIEAKFMKHISLGDPRICYQLMDMIDFLAANDRHKTVKRFVSDELTRMPDKASEEGLAVLVFLTPENTVISNDLLTYAKNKKVKIYQMGMICKQDDGEWVTLTAPKALSGRSLHFYGHTGGPFPIKMNWNKRLIDPDTGRKIDY